MALTKLPGKPNSYDMGRIFDQINNYFTKPIILRSHFLNTQNSALKTRTHQKEVCAALINGSIITVHGKNDELICIFFPPSYSEKLKGHVSFKVELELAMTSLLAVRNRAGSGIIELTDKDNDTPSFLLICRPVNDILIATNSFDERFASLESKIESNANVLRESLIDINSKLEELSAIAFNFEELSSGISNALLQNEVLLAGELKK
jgi:hypothetical protein